MTASVFDYSILYISEIAKLIDCCKSCSEITRCTPRFKYLLPGLMNLFRLPYLFFGGRSTYGTD
jgi:hypothetical protein